MFFHELNVSGVHNATVILDIDGTIMCSSEIVASDSVRDVIKALQKNNSVYLFSNNFNGKRSRRIAKDLNLPYIESPHRKPNIKILKYVKNKSCPVITIGDKYLTDGLFAQFTSTKHIRVKRYHCENDSLWSRFACYVDDFVYAFARLFRIAK